MYPANIKRVSPQLKELQRVWFGEGGKRNYILYPVRTSFGRYSARKAYLSKIGSKLTGTT